MSTTATPPQHAALKEFLEARLESVPGWMHHEAAYFTGRIFGVQRELGVGGPILEIGVFKGKYLSLLYELSGKKDPVVGVDLFVGTGNLEKDIEAVRENVERVCGDASRLQVLFADSTQLTPQDLQARSGCGQFRFISVDGGHTKDVVLHDLEIAHAVLAEGGVMALDDAYNQTTPGVIEAITEYLRRKPGLAPFAHCYNKMFVTTPSHHARYLAESWKFVEEEAWLAANVRTWQMRKDHRTYGFTSEFFGYEIVPFV